MPVLLPNALLTTARGSFNPLTFATNPPTPHLTNVECYIEPTKAPAFRVLPDAALASTYMATVDTGTDIAFGDIIVTITLEDGVTPWPGDYPQGGGAPGSDPTSLWVVVYHLESAPGLFASRMLYLGRYTGQGPLHI